MTDRVNALTVVLDENTRVDDLEPLLTAIRMLKGVLSVKTHVANLESHIAEGRARRDLGDKLWAVLYGKDKS
jgi:hypothetical protein